MGSLDIAPEATRTGRVGLVITGFGPFAEITENPTEVLAQYIAGHFSNAGEGTRAPQHEAAQAGEAASEVADLYDLLQHKVLNVATQDVDEWIDTVLKPCLSTHTHPTTPSAAHPGSQPQQAAQAPILVLHMGVATSATKLRLEQCCYNEACFRIPDRRGWQPQQAHCIDDTAPLASCLRTPALNLHTAAHQLSSGPHAFPVEVSDNPGRFLCNWVYYRSMRLVQGLPQDTHRSRVHVLFVHVPHFDKVGEEAQKRFLVSLLQILHGQITSGCESGTTNTLQENTGQGKDAEQGPSLTPPPLP